MQTQNVCLEAMAYTLPEKILSSKEIEEKLGSLAKRFELPSGFFEILTGIKERRVWAEDILPSQKSIESAKKLMQENGLTAKDMDCIVHVSVSRDFLEPATATAVHHGLNLPESCMAFDITNACLGFLNGMMLIASMIETGQIQRGLIVGTEIPTKMVQSMIQKLLTSPTLTLEEASFIFPTLTLGSGSCAMTLAHPSVSKTKHRLIGGLAQNDTTQFDVCKAWPDTGIFNSDSSISMKTQSQALITKAITLAQKTWPLFLKEISWNQQDVSHIFSHQVGRMPREEMLKAINLKSHLDFPTYEFLGNMGSVSLPISMAMGIEKRKVQPHDKVVLFGFGSGVHCFCMGVKW
ncbi:MAG: 3-oxoacyl-ACP synthase III [Deltaproteobacteria bacterium RIFCSPHIGHO2_02_FULL_40_11]|nr:MAG: 3-oxoacyl-ACP synthase III [Deltaproteobacteria bacterium RIFCSPHIGHO2_02_FULL_40_11]